MTDETVITVETTDDNPVDTPEPITPVVVPVTTVVDTSNDDDDDDDTPDAIAALALIVGANTARIDALETQAANTAVTADVALDLAAGATVEPETPPEPDEEPEHLHPWHRKNPFHSDGE